MIEKCKNPWKKDCEETDIQLYIQIKKEPLPICHSCWLKIADSKKEWGPTTTPIDTTGNLVSL
jgi:hypothetical protein